MHCKICINEHIIEVHEYEQLNINPIKPDIVADYGQSINYLENYETTVRKRRKTVYDLAIANFTNKYSKFLSLSFADNVTDLKYSNREFKKFIQRISYEIKNPLKYIAVIEFQKRGAIHYHILCDMPYLPHGRIAKIWGNGSIKINKIKHVDNLGAYITKYMTKDNADERLQTVKGYNCSKGLKRPIVLKSWNGNEKVIKALIENYGLTKEKAVYSAVRENGKDGMNYYYQYNLKRK